MKGPMPQGGGIALPGVLQFALLRLKEDPYVAGCGELGYLTYVSERAPEGLRWAQPLLSQITTEVSSWPFIVYERSSSLCFEKWPV